MLRKNWRLKKKGTTEDEMVGWHHWLSGHDFEQTPGDSERQGSLVCCSLWSGKETRWSDWTATTTPPSSPYLPKLRTDSSHWEARSTTYINTEISSSSWCFLSYGSGCSCRSQMVDIRDRSSYNPRSESCRKLCQPHAEPSHCTHLCLLELAHNCHHYWRKQSSAPFTFWISLSVSHEKILDHSSKGICQSSALPPQPSHRGHGVEQRWWTWVLIAIIVLFLWDPKDFPSPGNDKEWTHRKSLGLTDLENKLTVARETRIGRLQDMYTQLYSEWVTNKEMYSTCNSILCGSLDGSGV